MASSRLVRGILSTLVAVTFGASSVVFAVEPSPSGAAPAAQAGKDTAARKEAREERREERREVRETAREAARKDRDAARSERKAGQAEMGPDARRGSQGKAASGDKKKKEHRAHRSEGERRDKGEATGKGRRGGKDGGKGEKRRKGEVKPAPAKPAAPVRRPPPRPVAPRPAPAPSVIQLSPVAGAGDSVIGDRTMTGCRIQSALPQAIANRNAKVKLTDRPVAGRVLTVKIIDVAARGGGILSGSKGLGVEGRLYQDGRIVGSFNAYATSRGAMSSCGILDKVVADLADRIAAWVDKPAMNSILGEPR